MNKISIKKKIIISIITTCAILGIVVGLVVFAYLNNVLENKKIQEISKLNTEQVHETEQILKKDQLFVKMLGTRTRVKEFLLNKSEDRRKELLGIFNDYAKEDSKYLAIYLLDNKGTCLISTDERFIDQDYSYRDYFKKSIKNEATMDVFIGKTSGQFGYYFAHPALNDFGEVIGVMVVKVDNKEIDQSVLNSEVATDSSLMIVDENGVIIFSNKPGRFLKSLGVLSLDEKKRITETDKFLSKEISPIQYEEAQQIIRNQEGPKTIKIYDEEDGEEEILNVVKVGNFPLYLVNEIGLEDVSNSVFNITLVLLLIIFVGLFFIGLTFYKLFSIIISPIKEFKDLSDSISKGDFSMKLKINTKDEFADLADAFNKMSDNLSGLYKNLENKVKERTNKLEESENILKKTLEDSERVNKLMVGRELEMIKLKKYINEFKNKS